VGTYTNYFHAPHGVSTHPATNHSRIVRQRAGVIYYDVQENRTGSTDQGDFSGIEGMNIDDGFKLF